MCYSSIILTAKNDLVRQQKLTFCLLLSRYFFSECLLRHGERGRGWSFLVKHYNSLPLTNRKIINNAFLFVSCSHLTTVKKFTGTSILRSSFEDEVIFECCRFQINFFRISAKRRAKLTRKMGCTMVFNLSRDFLTFSLAHV